MPLVSNEASVSKVKASAHLLEKEQEEVQPVLNNNMGADPTLPLQSRRRSSSVSSIGSNFSSADWKDQKISPLTSNQVALRPIHNQLYPKRLDKMPRIGFGTNKSYLGRPWRAYRVGYQYLTGIVELMLDRWGEFSPDHTFFTRIELAYEIRYARNVYCATLVKNEQAQYVLGKLKKKWRVEPGESAVMFGKNRELAKRRYAFLKHANHTFELEYPGDDHYAVFSKPALKNFDLDERHDKQPNLIIPLGKNRERAQVMLSSIK